MAERFVFDAYAVLALLDDELGAEDVAAILRIARHHGRVELQRQGGREGISEGEAASGLMPAASRTRSRVTSVRRSLG